MKLQFPIICTTLLLLPLSTSARETIVNGTIGTGIDYWERTYDNDTEETDSDDGDKREIGIWPEIAITSLGIKDSLSFRYAPVFKYDDVTSSTDIDHYLTLSGERLVTRNWSFSLADNFVLSDDPYFSNENFAEGSQTGTEDAEAEEATTTVTQEQQTTSLTGNKLSKDAGRQRYWTNALSASTNYTFSETGSLGGGYTYSVLRNDSDGEDYDEYDKHAFFANIAYGFSQSWQTSLGVNYSRGLYEEDDDASLIESSISSTVEDETIEQLDNLSDDLDEYGASLQVDYIQSTRDSIPFSYDFSGTKYDEELRQDSYAHNLSVGWDHAFDSRTRLAVGAGPSYADAEGVKGEWDYNFYLNFTRDYEHAAFALLLDKQYDTQNFTGSNDSGLKDTYNARATFNYQYTQNLSLDVYGLYSWESNYTPRGEYLVAAVEEDGLPQTEDASISDLTYEKNIYEAGAGLSYSFMRYFNTSLRYTYYVSDGELDSDQYSDHRLMFKLTASSDLWKW